MLKQNSLNHVAFNCTFSNLQVYIEMNGKKKLMIIITLNTNILGYRSAFIDLEPNKPSSMNTPKHSYLGLWDMKRMIYVLV